jgi:hypothetical protein
VFNINKDKQELLESIEAIGLKCEIINKKDVLIKINLSGPYKKNHPRTDMAILKTIVSHISQNGGRCAIAEGARGFLAKHLIDSGFGDMLKQYNIKVIDIDLEDSEEVVSNGEKHYIPKCFKEYPVRVAIPAASKREGMVYSNNIKLFVGAVPRRKYLFDGTDASEGVPRPKIHQNLHSSVACLFLAINGYSPFQFYINGGLSYNENKGEFTIKELLVGNNALELDCHIFHKYFDDCEYPEYLNILKKQLR